MPIKGSQIHEAIRRKYNRANSDFDKTISVADIDSYFNEAKDIVFENYAAVVEKNTTVRNHLRQLEVKGHCGPVEKTELNAYYFKYPTDFYRLLRQTVIARKKGCSQERELIVHIFQTDDLSESLKDPFWSPSWDYEETLGDEAGDGLYIYHNDDFEVVKVCIDYLRKLPDIATPSLAVNKSYVTAAGITVSTDADLIIDSTFLWRKMVDVAVLNIARDTADIQDYQSQLQKILQLEQIFLV